ncbi:MAG: ATP-binding protein [Bacteroidota bacterium]
MFTISLCLTSQAQEGVTINGKVLTTRGLPVGAVSVSVDGGRPILTDKAGQFQATLPKGYAKPKAAEAEKNGLIMKGMSFHQIKNELTIVMQANPSELKGQVRNEKHLPISGVKITILDLKPAKSAITDAQGKFLLKLPSEYEFTTDLRLAVNDAMVKSINSDQALAMIDLTLPSQNTDVQTNNTLALTAKKQASAATNVVAANYSVGSGFDYEAEFERITIDLKEDRQALEVKSIQLRKEINRITDRLNNEVNLSAVQQEKLNADLTRLEKTLRENGIAYQLAQAKTEEVIKKMRQVILRQDSLQVLAKENLKQIQIEKEYAEAAKKETEIQSKRNLIYFSLIALGLLLLAIVFYLISKRIRKQSEEIKIQNEILLQQRNEIERKNEYLKELDREKNGVMNVVAHDLRAPLNRIDGMLSLMPLVGDFNKEQEEYLAIINKTLRDGKRFISDLLDVNAIEEHQTAIEWEEVELTAFLKDHIKEYSQQAENKNIEMHYQDNGQPILFTVDRNYLLRILDNLISNALKFSSHNRSIFISLNQTNDMVSIKIRDQGQGISEEDRKKMYKKFQRLSAQPTGGESSSGLGLSIVKTLVERLNGRIDFTSELGKGSEFTVELPVKQ